MRPMENAYWVIPGQFLAGEHPFAAPSEEHFSRLEALLDFRFDTFCDLTHPGELPAYWPLLQERAQARGLQVEYHSFPIPDFGVPSVEEMRHILDTVEALLKRGRRLYLHCWGGVGRTGTVIGCYLVRRGLNGTEALQQLQLWWQAVPKSRYHPQSPETDEQRQFVLGWKE